MHGSADELDIIDDAADELEIVDDATDELVIVDDAADELDIVDGVFRIFRVNFRNLSIYLETQFFYKKFRFFLIFHLALKKHNFIYRGFIYKLPNKKRFFSENRFFRKLDSSHHIYLCNVTALLITLKMSDLEIMTSSIVLSTSASESSLVSISMASILIIHCTM